MGLFENLGRKVGEFTHEAKQAADQEATDVCTDCGEHFYTAQDECPACGSTAIVERQANSTNTETDTDTSSNSSSDSGSVADSPAADDSEEKAPTE